MYTFIMKKQPETLCCLCLCRLHHVLQAWSFRCSWGKKIQCSSTLPPRRPTAFWDTVMLCFDMSGKHTAMQHNNDSQLVWLYCVLCSTLPKKKKETDLISKRKIYAKPKSTFNTVGVEGQRVVFSRLALAFFPMRKGAGQMRASTHLHY